MKECDEWSIWNEEVERCVKDEDVKIWEMWRYEGYEVRIYEIHDLRIYMNRNDEQERWSKKEMKINK